MAGRKKTILDEVEAIESAVAAELTESNNLNKTQKTDKAEKPAKAEKTVKADKVTKTEKAVETEKTSKTKKSVKTEKTAKTEKAAKTEKSTKTKKVAETDKTSETEKTVEAHKVAITEQVATIDTGDEVDDIVEYIQPSSLEALKARYGVAEEDEQIRNEGFELAKKSGLVRRSRPEETSFDYYSAPAAKDDIRTDVDSSLSEVFDATKSDFDADTVSFEDIVTDEKTHPEVTAPVSQEAIKATGNRYGYDTHTTVIYVDESADDGIRRNSETELTTAFTSDSKKHKRRKFPWLRKRK